MIITYTYQYRFLPKQWTAPSPPPITDDEHVNLLRTLEYRRLIVAPYLKNWLSVLNFWRLIIRFAIMPSMILLLLIGIGWLPFLILMVIVGIISVVIWAKIRVYERTASIIQLVIDEVLNNELGIQLKKILEDD